MKVIRLYQLFLFALLFNSVLTRAEIQLQAPEAIGAGGMVSITWQGKGSDSDFITIVAIGTAEGKYNKYQYARKRGPVKLRAPDVPGDYEIRYLGATKPYETIARSHLSVTQVTAEIQAPREVQAGATLNFSWRGPDNDKDFITLVEKEAPERKYRKYQYTRKGASLRLNAPDEPGDYELRYLMGGSLRTLARSPVKVLATSAKVAGPNQVRAGTRFSVSWEGPDNQQDFITLVKRDAAPKSYAKYRYTNTGNPVKLKAPDEPGDYQVRYLTGGRHYTLASYDLTVTATNADLEAPDEAMAGAMIEIHWKGPNNQQDFVSVVKQGAREGAYDTYSYTHRGNPVVLAMPERPGDYELRYITGESHLTLASRPIHILPASASLQAPESIELGQVVPVSWQGPGNDQDYLIIVARGSEHNRDGPYAYVRRGKHLRIASPPESGEYEVRYVTGGLKRTLASVNLQVTPSMQPGTLRVVRNDRSHIHNSALPAMAVILDASGSMLQRMEGRRRIEVAREALLKLIDQVVPERTPFALRVFGHKEKDSCRTDLEIPLRPLNKAAAKLNIAGINAMNLARTPIADSLRMTLSDLASAKGEKIILLITDGEETCDGDPAAAIQEISDSGAQIQVNIVGFAIDELMLREAFQQWARLGNGRYFDAQDAQQLEDSLKQSMQEFYEVIGPQGELLGAGEVGGEAIELPPGRYRVKLSGKAASASFDINIASGELEVLGI